MVGREGAFRLIVGLGNPGAQYEGTRHNAGFWLVDELVRRSGIELRQDSRMHGAVARAVVDGYDCRLLCPSTYMNHSGDAVGALAAYFKIPTEAILIAHDEIDLPVGSVRLKRGGGHGGHNGLRHLQKVVGGDFARIRIGVGHPGHKDQVVPYVLSRPSEADRRSLEIAIDEAADAVVYLLAGEWDRGCRLLHR